MQRESVTVNKITLKQKRDWKRWFIHLAPLPALSIYFLFVLYPIFAAFTYSLYDWQGIRRGAYIGLDNFIRLFTTEPFHSMFWNAFHNNVYYFVLELIAQNGIAFLLAYIIYQKISGAYFLKAAYFMPRLLSVIVVGFLWKIILNPNVGALNVFLNAIGLDQWAKPWLGDPNTALTAVILVNSWFGMGFILLIFLAGLQGIPKEIIESARLEGARGLTLVTRIMLPLMMHAVTIATVFTFIHAFEAFELVYAMQGSMGAPNYATDTLAVFFYRLAFGGSSADSAAIGLGSALAVVLFTIIVTISAVLIYFLRKREVQY